MLDTMLIEYDDTLINRLSEIRPDNFYGKNQTYANQNRALSVIRYAIENILQWDEDTAIKKFDNYMIKQLKLEKIASYIDYPDEVSPNDARYILSLLYPQKLNLDHEQLVGEVFKRVLNHEDKQFPRDYFSGGIGFNRFCYCIKYILETNLALENISDIYEFFSSIKGKNILLEHRLRTPAYQYAIDLYDVIFTITRDYEDAELWYSYYCFNRELKKIGKAAPVKSKEDIDAMSELMRTLDYNQEELTDESNDDEEENNDSIDINDLTEEELQARLKAMDIDMSNIDEFEEDDYSIDNNKYELDDDEYDEDGEFIEKDEYTEYEDDKLDDDDLDYEENNTYKDIDYESDSNFDD